VGFVGNKMLVELMCLLSTSLLKYLSSLLKFITAVEFCDKPEQLARCH
jgi:hypothetical protein